MPRPCAMASGASRRSIASSLPSSQTSLNQARITASGVMGPPCMAVRYESSDGGKISPLDIAPLGDGRRESRALDRAGDGLPRLSLRIDREDSALVLRLELHRAAARHRAA